VLLEEAARGGDVGDLGVDVVEAHLSGRVAPEWSVVSSRHLTTRQGGEKLRAGAT
jgi:hypothetical protein